ncbi:hypothetical protein [Isoptericola variabilis]|uniref:Uncharacterized protein n=1 Tax=Isoptericola variabilis (strain 225) TaxID=743718 RepID=F6FVQ2_ISOV2|nr:hypothetical protein [Isoptericola variabilis]AEG45553.1 hypothetical protein Isova_2867 [Isoptericola variabilis 225]TWH25843.1 hypothetical protein L600_000900000930 [Isoptericola variabilis J7]
MTATADRAGTPSRYALILPPGFVLIPAQGDVEADVRAVVKRHYGAHLNDRTRGRVRRLEQSLVATVSSAKERGVVDVVLPLGVPWRVPVSLAAAFAPARHGGEPVAGPGSTTVRTRAGDARREVVEHDRDDRVELDVDLPEPAPGGPLRTVHHVWESPARGVDRLVGTFTISGSADPELAPMVDALTELGDTIMASLRWRGIDTDTTEESA